MELILLFLLYMLPWMIAIMRGAFNTGGIFMTNLLLGWTVLFWIIALIWAFSADTPRAAKKRAKYMNQ